MLELLTPRGLRVSVPQTEAEDPSPRFNVEDATSLRTYYADNGYAVVRGLVSIDACKKIRELWSAEVKPSQSFIYRQATAKAERHTFNANGWVMNPILNLQSVCPREFPNFRRYAVENILTSDGLSAGFSALLEEQPKVVQSMYFEGNAATWEHQDSYYLDSERVGSMVAAWVALEDIDAEAGRFFVCPKSHLLDLGKQNSQNNIADHHEDYIQSVVHKVRELGLEIRAPALKAGDVLFWNSWTIHGSLDSQSETHSRASITCHAIPVSHRFMQLQARIVPTPTELVNDVAVYRPKDLRVARNRAILAFESRLPSIFYFAKRLAVKAMVAARNG